MFLFPNSWGEDWGDGGWGQMPFSYFDARLIEAWATGGDPDHEGSLKRFARGGSTQTIQWEARSIWREPLYIFIIYDPEADERIGWTFVLMRNDFLEVEELYVRPEYRGQGYGRELVDTIRVFARGKNRPMRLWVPFADSKQESPQSIDALVSVVRRLGLKFRKCDVRWAAYLGVSDGESDVPIEPDRIPPRAMSTRDRVRAAALALGTAVGCAGPGNSATERGSTKSIASIQKAVMEEIESGMPNRSDSPVQTRRPYTGFDREQAAYAQRKPDLLGSSEGQYVVLVGQELLGPFATYGEALRAGYRHFGRGPLYVKRVVAVEPVAEVTRHIAPCPP